MKRVITHADSMLIGHLRAVLLEQGIECIVKNEHLAGAVGELPAHEVWPQLWVLNDSALDQARSLVAALLETPAAADAMPWTCPRCGELHPPQFSECWRCAGATLKA